MSQPQPTAPRDARLEALIDAMERPLLVLALVAMGLYLLDICGIVSGWPATTLAVLTFVIDSIFALDLALKLWVYGKSYTETPWCLIDVLSSLPLIDTLTNGLFSIRSVRFFRGFRILRIFRGLRVLRALRSIPGFERLSGDTRSLESKRQTHRALDLGMLALTATMIFTIALVRKSLEREYRGRIQAALTENLSVQRLTALGGSLVPTDDSDLELTATVDHQKRTVYFDYHIVDRQIDRAEFFLTLGMMFSMLMFMYIMGYHHIDVTETQLRGLLNLALPHQVANQFLAEPMTYTRKSRTPATVLFMDFVGFTQTCEALASEPDRLSAHLESAMDRLVGELTRHDMIIDKFIGDAVMSFRGGPLVPGTPVEHARRAVLAALASTNALNELDDPYFHRVKIGGASDENCLIGAFGTSARLSYTILGDGVNLAARLEPASAQCATPNLFDEATYRLTANAREFAWRRWGWIRVAGKSEPISVYEAFDAARLGDREFLTSFAIALEAFERHDFDRARDLFVLADSQCPGGDEPSRLYAHRCESLILGGRPVGWEPVFETHK